MMRTGAKWFIGILFLAMFVLLVAPIVSGWFVMM